MGTGRAKEPFRQAIPKLGLSVELGTAAVPDDGQYHVLLDGGIVFSSGSQEQALSEYRSRRDHLLKEAPAGRARVDVKALLQREMAEFDTKKVLQESYRQRKAKATRKGGKGGSGGVGG